MRLIYLCAVDPPPPKSDFSYVSDFFKSIPEYLHPKTREMTLHICSILLIESVAIGSQNFMTLLLFSYLRLS